MSRPKKPTADDIARAERLRDLREARWLTPSELAIRSGIDLSEISRLESGISKFTSPKIQQKLAAVYECSVGDLVNYVLSSGPAPDGSLSRGVAAAQSECVCDGLQANLQKQLSDALGQAAEARKECAKLRAEAQRLRSEASIDSSSAIIARVEHRSAVAEADELRRLAWAYCIEATRWRTQEAIRGRYEDRLATLLSRICGLVGCELGHEVEGVADVVDRLRSAEVMFAKYVDHLPTAVLADSPAQPIESVGALALLRRLDGGGSVVPTSALTPAEIAVARSGYRMWVDSRGYGYVYLPGAHRRVDATAAQTPIESLGPDVHEVALRIFVEMQVTSAYERAVAAAYEKARAFVDHREAVLRGEKSEWESDR